MKARECRRCNGPRCSAFISSTPADPRRYCSRRCERLADSKGIAFRYPDGQPSRAMLGADRLRTDGPEFQFTEDEP